MAHEFYDDLHAHKSWPYVTYKFITDPSVGMWSRAKRTGKGKRLEQGAWIKVGEEGSASESEMSEGESESEGEVSRGMEEAVERGYGSDRECGRKEKVA